MELLEDPVACPPYRFVTKRGDPIAVGVLAEEFGPRLVEAYLAFQPRDCFQGLPPLDDEVCVKWVRHLLDECVNLVATSADERIVGHLALVPASEAWWEMLVAVWPSYQNIGIGTELVRGGIAQSRRLGAEGIMLCVEAAHCRARHVYEKCGFRRTCEEPTSELILAKRLWGRDCEAPAVPILQTC